MNARFLKPVAFLVAAAVSPRSTTPIPETRVQLLAEAERTMERLIIGLDPSQTKYYMLPETTPWDAKSADPRVRYLRRRLYWLNFELLHGGILKAAPDYTRFFVAVPDSRIVTESLGNEEEVFREYLKTRVGWSDQDIARRVRFFKTPAVVAFPRDMAEPLGRDGRGRLVLGIGSDSDAWYAEPLRRLVEAYPGDFDLKTLPEINTEGGDLSIVPRPEGGLGLLVGYHRVLRYLHSRYGVPMKGMKIEPARIEEARQAYGKAFFGLPVAVVGEEALRDPSLVSDELFHLDMVVNVLRGHNGIVAFVPSYREAPVDSIRQAELSENVRQRIQREYDRVAREFEGRGYRVVRLPFRDHPDRTPVQVGDFVDQRTGSPSVLLGRYPFHLNLADGSNPQRALQESLGRLEETVARWRHAPDDTAWSTVVAGIDAVWRQMDAAQSGPNPTFDQQARMYESEGIRVVPVPIYPTGEGGLHCLLLD